MNFRIWPMLRIPTLLINISFHRSSQEMLIVCFLLLYLIDCATNRAIMDWRTTSKNVSIEHPTPLALRYFSYSKIHSSVLPLHVKCVMNNYIHLLSLNSYSTEL